MNREIPILTSLHRFRRGSHQAHLEIYVRHQRNDLIFHRGIKNDFRIHDTSTDKLK
jgi:hypothetical protein